MVIPSFYICDDHGPSVCTRYAELIVSEPQSSTIAEQFHTLSPAQQFNNHHDLSLNEREREINVQRRAGQQRLGDGQRGAEEKILELQEQGPSSWRESEIITNLFLGDLQDARRFDGMIISVLADLMAAEPGRTIHLPFLANGRATLDSTAAVIDAGLRLGMRVLVHCEEGCERAPLVIAWFLRTRRGLTLDEAYALIKSQRPIVRDRRAWLGIYNR